MSSIYACPLRGQVDPRLLRFSAGSTAGVLAVFAVTAFVSLQWSVWGQIFARFRPPQRDPLAAR